MKLVNLTRDPVMFRSHAGKDVILASEGHAKITRDSGEPTYIDGIPVPVYPSFTDAITGLPDPQEGTMYIVSWQVGEAVANRYCRFYDEAGIHKSPRSPCDLLVLGTRACDLPIRREPNILTQKFAITRLLRIHI